MSELFAVMGNPVSHSLSPVIHQAFAAQFGHHIQYEKILVEKETFTEQVNAFFESGGKGLNVTLPCKELAFHLCQALTPYAKSAHAVNTLWEKDGILYGANTDGIGLVQDLRRYKAISGAHILILGAGGAASGIIPALQAKKPASITVANRTMSNAQTLQERFEQIKISAFNELDDAFDLMINATSLSLKHEVVSLPEQIWAQRPFCYDLTYNLRANTSFVAYALNKQCEASDGLGMLVEQAAESYNHWQGVRPETLPVLNSLKESFDY